ncbi:hypothetical protein [Herbaspirillum sp. RV1423]|uniref:hypothetical protein n=1 Tax=Herbaspirillum sp. RV1423 TaxID=1443993 RepID=UPI0004B5C6A5|nr:hypothetical protein [Herbaspirillum sp. RV1423]
MKVNKRLVMLSVLLLLVIAAAWKLSAGEDASVAISEPAERSVPPPKQPVSKTPGVRDLALDKLSRLEMSVGDVNPFTPKSWYVPPPPPPPQPPPKPTAPPLPFSYVGKLEEDGENWTIYLSKGTESFVIKKGDTFDNSYRFDGVENGNLIIQYLPMGIRQTLSIGTGL